MDTDESAHTKQLLTWPFMSFWTDKLDVIPLFFFLLLFLLILFCVRERRVWASSWPRALVQQKNLNHSTPMFTSFQDSPWSRRPVRQKKLMQMTPLCHKIHLAATLLLTSSCVLPKWMKCNPFFTFFKIIFICFDTQEREMRNYLKRPCGGPHFPFQKKIENNFSKNSMTSFAIHSIWRFFNPKKKLFLFSAYANEPSEFIQKWFDCRRWCVFLSRGGGGWLSGGPMN